MKFWMHHAATPGLRKLAKNYFKAIFRFAGFGVVAETSGVTGGAI